MTHIALGNDQPGIVGLFHYRPQTGRPMSELAEVLLRGDNSLSRGERELIAAYVSARNDCRFCFSSHAAFAEAQLPEGTAPVADICANPVAAAISDKMKALLDIAGAVQQGGKTVTDQQVAAARAAGASDVEIHDTVLIAAAFCMFNRYVDGLAALTPDDPADYKVMADFIIEAGYLGALSEPRS